MTTLEEVVKECVALRSRVKALEEVVTVVQRSAKGSAATLLRLEQAEAARGAASEPLPRSDDIVAEEESESSSQHPGRQAARVVTCLSRHVLHSEVAEQSPWFQALFPEACIYTLPVGAVKSGRIPTSGFDPILSELVRRGDSVRHRPGTCQRIKPTLPSGPC